MSAVTHDFAPRIPRIDEAASDVGADRRTPHKTADARVTLLPTRTAPAPVLREAPRNHAELDALLAERAQQGLSRPQPEISLAAQTGSALAVLTRSVAEMPPLEAEARAKLRDALNARAGAREALAAKEAALAKARQVEHEAIVAESKAGLVESTGGDDFARRVINWAEKGGEEPELAPDLAALDARHERDRARVKAAAARQAVAAIGEVVEAKRAALAEAETKVQAAARSVVEATAEGIAAEGRKAGEIHRRAQLAAHALQRMQNGLAAQPLYRLKPDTAELAKSFTGPRPNEPADALSGATVTWQAFQRALETDADAALG